MRGTKIIWTYWHQGFGEAPDLVRRCTDRWKALHPDWEINMLDARSIKSFIDPIPIASRKKKAMGVAHYSDLLRTQLLIKYGGVWADPTCYPVKPLDDWLPEYMEAGLFLFSRPGRDRAISNWFIAAEPQNPFLIKLYNSLCTYWDDHEFRNLGQKGKTELEKQCGRVINRNLNWPRFWFSPIMTKLLRLFPYMVYHYKFYDLVKTDAECRAIYEKIPKFPAYGMQRLQRFGLLDTMTPEAKRYIDQKKMPMYKLTWKLHTDEFHGDSLIVYLLNGQEVEKQQLRP